MSSNESMVKTGVDVIISQSLLPLKHKRTALLANQASLTGNLVHTAEALISTGLELAALFGPQHGYQEDTQANMIEWEGYHHPLYGIPVYSLYGHTRKPEKGVLRNIDTLIIDLQDTGSRPYTYLWTAMLAMEACAQTEREIVVLDRPNPLGGQHVEGPVLHEDYKSLVGLFPLPMRHGLTMGEALNLINQSRPVGCELNIITMEGWTRDMHYRHTGLAWVMPSPNMPTTDTAWVYPGSVMLEGTNISEGRGTTRPFEIVGAPWIESEKFAGRLNRAGLKGVYFRPIQFRPTWDKYRGEICGGAQIHVTDRNSFLPVRCGAVIIKTAAETYPRLFHWKSPPYEYEYHLPPIDIITGSRDFRNTVESGGSLTELMKQWDREASHFIREREGFLLY